MKTSVKVLTILKKTGAVFTNDHFVYTSGKHGRTYVNKDAIYPHTFASSEIGKIFAEKYKTKNMDIVASPALGAIILSQWTAYHLSKIKRKEILGIYTEKTSDKNQILTRGYDKLVKGKKVLIIEDIVTTGGSIKKVVKTITDAGGIVLGACAIVNKDPKNIDTKSMGIPFDFLTIIDTDVFDEASCPMCQQHMPVNTVLGHGKEFLKNCKETNKVIFKIERNFW